MGARAVTAFAAVAAIAALPLSALADTAGDPVSNALGGLSYRAIGPAISGGRTTAVAGTDSDPRIYYAGGAGGGVFKSSDGGVSWKAVTDKLALAPIGAIAVDPSNAGNVWLGTGEAYPRNDSEEGAGVWHSTDGGASWKHAGLDDAGAIASISIDPRDPKRVAVGVLGHVFRDGTMRGVYTTRDGGATWTRSLYVGPSSGVSQLVRVPGHPSTLFAGIWQFRREPWMFTSGGPLGGLYRSLDNGATWRKLSGNGLPAGLTGRIGIAAAGGGRIYAIVQSKSGELWRSQDGGNRWNGLTRSAYIGARPFYFSRVYPDPANRNRLLAVSLIMSESSNGGRSFNRTATNTGWDYHAVWWSRDGRRIISGSDEGVSLSADGGKNWHQPYDLPFAQPYHVGYDSTLPSYRVCIGLQDNSSWCGPNSSDNGVGILNRDWYVVGPGDGMHANFDPNDSNLVWTTTTSSDNGQVFLYDERTKQSREVSPSQANANDAPSALKHRFNWDTPIAFAQDGAILAGGEVLFRSSDHGQSWTTLSGDLTRNDKSHQRVSGGPIDPDVSGAETSDTILSIAPSKREAQTIWIGTDDGLVQLTRDGGTTWKDVTPAAAPHWGRVFTIELSAASAGAVAIAVDNHMLGDDRPHIYATSDFGATWVSLAGDLPPNLFVRVVREDPTNANLLYAGTQRGVFVTWDRGTHWHPLRLNMPATAIYDLQIHPGMNDLIVAAHGRGIWILDDLRPLQDWAKTRGTGVALFAPHDAYRMWQTAPINTFTDGSLPDGEFTGENRDQGAIVSYYLARAVKAPRFEIADAQGRIVKHLAGSKVTGKTGLNRVSWDLTEDGPVRWKDTFEQNRGPKSGAEVVPGTYTVRLIAGTDTQEQPLIVKSDPRDPNTTSEAQKRHDVLAQLFGELSSVNTWLNTIDRRLRTASPAQAASLRSFKARLTLNPRNIEDLGAPPGLRENIEDLLGRISGSSFQAPTAAGDAQSAAVNASYAAFAAEYAGLHL